MTEPAKATKRVRKAKPNPKEAAQLPSELSDLLTPDEFNQDVNGLYRQSEAMRNIAIFLAELDRRSGEAVEIFNASNMRAIASHFKNIQDRGRTLTREIARANPHGRLVLAPLQPTAPTEEPQA